MTVIVTCAALNFLVSGLEEGRRLFFVRVAHCFWWSRW